MKAQSVLEYSMVIVCLIMALLAMQRYIKISVQGNMRQTTEELGQQYEARKTKTLEPQILSFDNHLVMKTESRSETELDIDLNERNGKENDVFGMTINSTLTSGTITARGREQIGGR